MIGTSLCTRLRASGYQVISAGRVGAKAGPDVIWHAGEVLGSAMTGADAVVHLAAHVHVRGKGFSDKEAFESVNTHATLRLAEEAAAQGVRRFVFMSSIGVLGGASSHPLREDDPVRPMNAYARSKCLAEEGLRNVAGLETVILRPPAVIGPAAPGNLGSIVGALRRGLPLPFGGISNARQFVTLQNLEDAILLAISTEAAAGETFHVANPELVSTPQLCRELAEKLRVEARIWPVSPALLQAGLALFGRRSLAAGLTQDLRIDTTKIRTLLGWRPKETLREGLQKMLGAAP